MSDALIPTPEPHDDRAVAEAPSTAIAARKWRFDDHPGFQETALLATAGGAAGGLVAELVMRVIGGVSEPMPLVLALAAGSALAAVGRRHGGWKAGLAAAVIGTAGGVLCAAALLVSPWLSALALGLAATPVLTKGVQRGLLAKTWLTTAMFATLMALGGVYVAQVTLHSEIALALLPGPVPGLLAGAVAGLFLGLGSAPLDSVEAAFAAALEGRSGELQSILERALALYRLVRDDLGSGASTTVHEQIRSGVAALSLRIADVAQRVESAPPSADERIDELRAKMQACEDPAARQTLAGAIASLEDQQRSIEAMRHGRERILARLQANLVLLEKVRFSLAHQRSADAERLGGAPTRLDEALEALTTELDASSEAVGEVYGGAVAIAGALPAPGEPEATD